MPFYDLLLLRLLLTSLLAGLLLAGFLLLRSLPAQWMSSQLRRHIWLILLILSCLFLPLPTAIKVPANWPGWIFNWRLPDPDVPILSPALIAKADADWRSRSLSSQLAPTGQTGIREGPTSQTDPANITAELAKLNLPSPGIKSRLLDFLLYWRWIWPIGCLLSLLNQLIRWQRRRKKSNKPEAASEEAVISPEQAAWQQEIVPLRDQCGYYRYADVILSGKQDDHLLMIWQHWHRHQIPVPTALPTEMDAAQRQKYLLRALDRNNHPEILLLLLLAVIRILIWFNPLWYRAGYWLREDLDLVGRDRVNRRQPERLPCKAGPGNWLLVGLLLPVLIASSVFLAWQLPRMILPAIEDAEGTARINVKMMALLSNDQLPKELAAESGQRLVGEQELAIIQNEDGLFSLVRPGTAAEKTWQTDITGLVNRSLWPRQRAKTITQAFLQDSQQMPDGRWTAILRLLATEETTIYLELSADGQQCLNCLDLSRIYAEFIEMFSLIQVNNLNFTLLPSGGWISWSSYLQPGSQIGQNADTVRYQSVMERYSAEGRLIWRKTDLDPLFDQLDLKNSMLGSLNHQSWINAVIPTADSGCYLIVSEHMGLYAKAKTDNKIRYADYLANPMQVFDRPDRIVRLDPAGEIIWSKNLPDEEQMFSTYQAEVGPNDNLYLAGILAWQTPATVLPDFDAGTVVGSGSRYRDTYRQAHLIAVRPDGQIIWQQTFFSSLGAMDIDLQVQSASLTILATNRVKTDSDEISYYQSIWQLDSTGKRQYYGIIQINSYLDYVWIEPGRIMRPSMNIDLNLDPLAE